MGEKRQLERFAFSVPARVSVTGWGDATQVHGRTRDLSAGGAFLFLGQTALPVGSEIEIEIDLTVDPNRSVLPTPQATCMHGKGKIIRTEGDGLAIAFEGQLQFAQ